MSASPDRTIGIASKGTRTKEEGGGREATAFSRGDGHARRYASGRRNPVREEAAKRRVQNNSNTQGVAPVSIASSPETTESSASSLPRRRAADADRYPVNIAESVPMSVLAAARERGA